MFERILNRVARRQLEHEVRKLLYAIGEVWWPADIFQQMAEEGLLPSQVALPDSVMKGLQRAVYPKVRMVLDAFSDDDLLVLLEEASPPHGKVAKAYPVWARAFLNDLRALIMAEKVVRH